MQLGADPHQLDHLGRRLHDLAAAIAGLIAGVDRELGVVPRSVLSVAPFGDGRAVVAVGDVGTARHIAVLVPGMGTELADVPSLVETAARIQRAANARAADGVAVVAWLGYDTPAGLDRPLQIGEVLSAGRARAGAEALRTFVASLPRSDVTLIGHSYGSLVVALAAAAPGIDRVIVIGSPGLGVDDVAALGIDPSDVYALAHHDDPVATSEWFGRSPTDPAFGARVLDAGRDPGIGTAHTSYFDAGSASLAAIAQVVAGG